MVNKVILVGNVGSDPNVRFLEAQNAAAGTGTKVASFSLATSERYRNRTTGETREETEWHNIVAWRQLADVVERFVKKGTQLYIEGRLRTRNYTDAQGVKHYVTEIQADTLQLLGRREGAGAPDAAATQPAQAYSAPSQPAQPYSAPAQAAAPAPQPAAPVAPVAFDNPSDDLPF